MVERQAARSSRGAGTRRRLMPPTKSPSAAHAIAAWEAVLEANGFDATSIIDGGWPRRATGGMGSPTVLSYEKAGHARHTGRRPRLLPGTTDLERAAGTWPTDGVWHTDRHQAGADSRCTALAERAFE